MQCFVYTSSRKADTYIWLRERDHFDVLPTALSEKLGELRFVLELELTPDRQLPREDAAIVQANLRHQGWHLQLPPAQELGR